MSCGPGDRGWRWLVLAVEWGPTVDGRFMTPRLAPKLCRQLEGKPFCAHLVAGRFAHVRPVDEAAVVGYVHETWSNSHGLLATVALDPTRPRAAWLRHGLMRLATARRLSSLGLSILGSEVAARTSGQTIVLEAFTDVLSLDVVDRPAGGGHLLRALGPDEDVHPVVSEREETTTMAETFEQRQAAKVPRPGPNNTVPGERPAAPKPDPPKPATPTPATKRFPSPSDERTPVVDPPRVGGRR